MKTKIKIQKLLDLIEKEIDKPVSENDIDRPFELGRNSAYCHIWFELRNLIEDL